MSLQQIHYCMVQSPTRAGGPKPTRQNCMTLFMGVLCLAAVFDWIKKDIKP
jgi:hypothetical protein